jgi:Zn-dependent protease
MYSWILLLALLWPLFWLIRVLLATRLLLGLELKPGRVEPLAPDAVPQHLVEAVQPWLRVLQPLGFRALGAMCLRHADERALDEHYVILTHAEQPVRAMLHVHESAAHSGECWLALRTTLANGHEIVTASHAPERLFPLPPGLDHEVLEGATAPEVFTRHLARIAAGRGGAWQCLDLEGAAKREQFLVDGVHAHRAASPSLARRGETLSYRFLPAVRTAVALLRTSAKQQKEEKRRRRLSLPGATQTLSEAARTEFDLRHYQQMRVITRGRMSLRAKAVLTTLSFLAFAAVLAWQLSPAVAVALLVALVVHEGGHLLGMWWFGFRDTQLLFIPFFGGAAVGHDDKVLKPWQHIVIILLGPLPGLFVGLVLYVLAEGGPEWLQSAALTTIVLNAFNLLPILPLDGGQIVDYAVASRFPRARVAFLAVSALGLLGISTLLDGVKLLLGVAVLTLLRLPTEWRLARLHRDLRAEFPEGGDEETIVRRLLTELREPEWKKTTAAQRLSLARGLQHVLRMARPGLGTMCFALAGYTAPIWGGVPLALWATQRRAENHLARAEQQAAAAGLPTRHDDIVAAPANVPPGENAAVPLGEAEALLGARFGPGPGRAEPANDAKVLALLREAARRRIFAPLPLKPTAAAAVPADALPLSSRLRARHLRGAGMRHLVTAAEERMRFREPLAAAELALDALRLVRLTDAVPGWLAWSTRLQLCESAWGVMEEVLASGAALPPAALAELHALIDERQEIKIALAAKPRELVQEDVFADAGDEPAGAARAFTWWRLVANLGGTMQSWRAQSIEHALAVQQALRDVQQGKWPEKTQSAEGAFLARMAVVEIADFLARLREARAALLVVQQRAQGHAVDKLEALGVPLQEWQHPLTHEPMRWLRRGATDVLALNGGQIADEVASAHPAEILWRLPAR